MLLHQYFDYEKSSINWLVRVMNINLKKSLSQGYPVSLIMLDVDDFKQYNDILGHSAGDAILRELGQIVRNIIREVDLAARYGGEEFAIILTDTELNEAINLTERVRVLVEQEQLSYGEKKVGVTISIGLAEFIPDTDLSNDILIDRADKALYKSKLNGRNQISY